MLDRRSFLATTAAGAMTPFFMAGCATSHEPSTGITAVPVTYPVTPGIHPELQAHGAIFARKIHRVADRIYVAVGWSICNTIMIVGDDGVIIVDTGQEVQSAREVAAEFRHITDKPVRAVIYTCFHSDHLNGVKGHVSADDVRAGRVAIIAHATLLANVVKSAVIGPILGTRTAYNFGGILGRADIEGMNNGTGPFTPGPAAGGRGGEATFIAPTRTFTDRLDLTIAGVTMQLVHVPSEAADEIAVFLPADRALLSAEVIPAETFPTLHPLRGEAYRDPSEWYRSIDRLRRFEAAALVPSHGVPVVGSERVEEILRNYRDAIQYVHDQTLRQMNRGLTPDELVDAVKLPPHLANFRPWMQEFFGTVRQAVRAIYQGYLGWFEGDPITLAPLAKAEAARREVALMGGRDRVLAVAGTAFEAGDPQWAGELATRLVRIDPDDIAARRLKASAFRKLGYAHINAIWRNWYLTAARELEGFGFDPILIQRGLARSITSPDLVSALSARAFVESFPARLKAEDTLDVLMSLGFRFLDVQEGYGITIRRGVGEFHERVPEKPDLTFTLDKSTLDRIRLGQLTMPDAVAGGIVQLTTGTSADVARFLTYFDRPFTTPIALVVR